MTTGNLPSFDIALFPTGDPDSSFNADHRNNPLDPWQRKQILQRKDVFNIQCVAVDVVHGKLAPGRHAEWASLLVFKFWFDKRRTGRRIANADIVLEFASSDPDDVDGDDRPEVLAISPHDCMAFVPTVAHEERSHDASINLGGSGAGVDVGGEYSFKKTITQDRTGATTVTGSIDLEGYLWGPPNCASWTLIENELAKTGVPSSLQVAVLLKRINTKPFQCMVDITVKPDRRTAFSWSWLHGSRSRDDPVLYNPSLPPTNTLRLYDTENLGTIVHEDIWAVGLVGNTTSCTEKKSAQAITTHEPEE